MTSRNFLVALAAAVAAVLGCPAGAADWPVRPITIINPYEAGGAVDVVARALAAKLGPELGQSIIIENRSGAGGTIGAAKLAHAAPEVRGRRHASRNAGGAQATPTPR